MKVLMPQLGETVAEGTISIWHKKIGDQVNQEELLFEVETDKAVMEIPAPSSGILTSILIKEGETVDVGTNLAVINDGQEEDEPQKSEVPQKTENNESAFGIEDPSLIERKRKNEAVNNGGKEDFKLSPVVRKLLNEHNLDPADITGSGKDGRIKRDDIFTYLEKITKNKDEKEGLKLSPVVRKLLKEHNLDSAEITGSGKDGRIKRNDVLAYLEKRTKTPVESAKGDTVIPFNSRRKMIADHMVRSKSTSPHVLQAVEVDFSAVDKARKTHGESWKTKEGFSLTYLPFIAYATCQAINDFPHVNASIDDNALIVHHHVNLAIAVDLNFEGLVAPVIREANHKNIRGLAQAIHDLAQRARNNKLGPDDLTGGSYTISNSGSFGTMITAPIINQPQVAILSADGITKKPVVIESEDGDAIAIRPIGVIAQSFDHRAIDGAYSAAFLKRVKAIIEDSDWKSML